MNLYEFEVLFRRTFQGYTCAGPKNYLIEQSDLKGA